MNKEIIFLYDYSNSLLVLFLFFLVYFISKLKNSRILISSFLEFSIKILNSLILIEPIIVDISKNRQILDFP